MSVLHEERQYFHWVFHVIIVGGLGGTTVVGAMVPDPSDRWPVILPVALMMLMYGMLMPMTVRVNSERVEVTFGRFGWPRWRFLIPEIRQAVVVDFSPLKDFGGWGIRRGPKGMCLNQRGSRGVAFEFRGRRYIIGSDHPEALLSAMHTAGVPRS